jgi:hypothetical protein
MTRKLLTALAVALLAAPAALSAQIHTGLSIAAGLAVPSGDLAKDVNSGYNLAAGLNIGVPLLPAGLRLEGAFNRFEGKNLPNGTSAHADIISGTANATFGLGLPYIIGGLGYYSTKVSASNGTMTATSDRANAFGLNGGVGLRFPLGVISTFAEIRYHKMMGGDNANTVNSPPANSAYIPITFGINF